MLSQLLLSYVLATGSSGAPIKTTSLPVAQLFPESSLDFELRVPAHYVAFKPAFVDATSSWICSPDDAQAITSRQQGTAASLPCLFTFTNPRDSFDPGTGVFSFEHEPVPEQFKLATSKRISQGTSVLEFSFTLEGARKHGLLIADGTKVYSIWYAAPIANSGDDSVWRILVDSL